MTKITLSDIRKAKTKRALRWLEAKIKQERDAIVNDPLIKSSVKSRAKKDYSRKSKAIRMMGKQVSD